MPLDRYFADLTARVWRAPYGLPDIPFSDIVPAPAPSTAFGTPLGTYSGTVPANAKFVDDILGNDTGTGGLSSPWRSFETAVSRAAVNDTIVLRGSSDLTKPRWIRGVGRNRAQLAPGSVAINLSRAGLKIMNAPGEAVGFDGSTVVTGGWTRDATSGFWWRSWTPFDWSPQYTTSFYGTALYSQAISTDDWTLLDGSDPGGNPSQDIYWQFIDTRAGTLFGAAARPERVFVREAGDPVGVQQRQVDKFALLQPGRFFIDAKTNRMWITVDPNGKTVEITTTNKLMNSLGTDQQILGIGVRRYAGSQPMGGVVQLHRPNALVEGCHFEDNAMCHIALVGSSNGIGPHGTLIKANNFIRGRNIQVRGSQSDRVTLEANDSLNGNEGGFNPAPASGHYKFTYLHDTWIKANRFRNEETADAPDHIGHGKMVWFDADVLRPKISSNESYGAGQRAYVCELTNDLTIFDNLDVNAGTESWAAVDYGGYPMVWNNTSIGCGRLRGKQETIVGLTYADNGVMRTVRSSRQPRVPGVSPSYIFDKRYSTTQSPDAPPLEPFPDSGVTSLHMDRQGNVIVGANVRAVFYDEEQRSAANGGKSYTQTGFVQDRNLVQPADSFTTGAGFTNDGILSLDSTVQQSGRPQGDHQVVANTLAGMQALGFEINGRVVAASAPDVVDANGNLKDSSLHALGPALPARLADLIGVPVGSRRLGRYSGAAAPAAGYVWQQAFQSATEANPFRIDALGDSISHGAGDPPNLGNSLPHNRWSWPGQLVEAIRAAGKTARHGWFPMNAILLTKPAYDDRIVVTGSVTNVGRGIHKASCFSIPAGSASAPSSYVTIKGDAQTTAFRLLVLAKRTTESTTSQVVVSVDGGAPIYLRNITSGGPAPTIASAAGFHAYHLVTTVPVENTGQPHTIRVSAVGDATVELSAAEVIKPAAVVVSNLSISGRSWLTHHFVGTYNGTNYVNSDETTGRYGLPFLDTFGADDPARHLFFAALGTNDYNAGYPLTQTQQLLTSAVQRRKSKGGQVAIMFPPWSTVATPAGGSTYVQHQAAFGAVASGESVKFFDWVSLFGSSYAAGQAAGMYADGIHPSDQGASVMAQNVLTNLRANG